MTIFVDADSCPRPARELILRTAERRGLRTVFAANRPIPGIKGTHTEFILCPQGEGAADDRIAALARPGDLAVTRDIPLAARLVAAGAAVLDDRGREYTAENVRERLSLRDFTVALAENGYDFERTPGYGDRERKAFANALDRLLTKLEKSPA